jgi:hypothetical protein
MFVLLLTSAWAQNVDTLVRCTATARHRQGELSAQAFAADFEAGKVAAAEQAWLEAELHQASTLWGAQAAGGAEWEAELARWGSVDASDPPRIPGVQVRSGACERIELPRHAGAWKATWGKVTVTADQPWTALEAARRRACVAPWEEGLGDPVAARDELIRCLGAEASVPAVSRESLAGPTQAAPAFICATPEGDLGGGTSLYQAREDALRARVEAETRAALAASLKGQAPSVDAVKGTSPAAENATVACTGPGRPLGAQTTDTCSGAVRRLALSGSPDRAELAGVCHSAAFAPTLGFLPTVLDQGDDVLAGGAATALSCDVTCRRGFAASGSFTVGLEGE